MELKVYEVQKSLINQHMTPKREQARKKIVNEDDSILFSDILMNQINKMKRGF